MNMKIYKAGESFWSFQGGNSHSPDKKLQDPKLTGKEKLKTEMSPVNCASCDKCHKLKRCLVLEKVKQMH